MKVLAIHSLTHDVSAALCVDGTVVWALEEERLSRKKHHPGIQFGGDPPNAAIANVLACAGLSLSDIDLFVHVGWPGSDAEYLDIVRRRLRDFARSLDPSSRRTIFVDHHIAHAAATYWGSGLERAIVAVLDGHGDYIATSLYLGDGQDLQKLDEYHVDQSLGLFFTRAAKTIGLGRSGFGEGKLTALAAYGSPLPCLSKMIDILGPRYRLDPQYAACFSRYGRTASEELTQEHRDFASSVQAQLVGAVTHLLQGTFKDTGVPAVCLGGGVALNCAMNGRVADLPWISSLYVNPGANDSGLAIGAAFLGAIRLGDRPSPLLHAYLGPGIDVGELQRFIESTGLAARHVDNAPREAARQIAKGRAVAWVQGRLEFGPRALGHRSLLGDPRSPAVRDRLNAIKGREQWRPIAPAVVDHVATAGLSRKVNLDCMTSAISLPASLATLIPAGVHVDGSARVQLVRDTEDSFFRLISDFESITGVPAVLNTSLNAKDEPLCATVSDAIKFFYTSAIDDLFIHNWWFCKRFAEPNRT